MTRRRRLLALAVSLVCLPGGKAKADISIENVKEWIRVATCADVREIVQLLGEKKAEEAARAAGATELQIARAKKCLK